MPQPNEISKHQPPAVHSSFVEYLLTKADEAERNAPAYEGSEFYPPAWWLANAAANRQLASEIVALEGRGQ